MFLCLEEHPAEKLGWIVLPFVLSKRILPPIYS